MINCGRDHTAVLEAVHMQHIPSGSIDESVVEPFEQSLDKALLPQEEYSSEHWLYVPNRYLDYRFILGTRGKRPLICIGINPSTAAPDALDPTLKSVDRIAAYNGYDSFLMFNVYAQRATCPNDMERFCSQRLHKENLKAFRYLLTLSGSPSVWAAWGNLIEKRNYLSECLADIADEGRRAGAVWYSAGPLLKSGNPHHPLYLRSTTALEPLDISEYLRTLRKKLGEK